MQEARSRAARRLAGTKRRPNAETPGTVLRRSYRPTPGARVPLEHATDRGQISARGADRIRMSWTVADLAGEPRPRLAEVSTALGRWLGRDYD
jgi:magnesium chelatase family protein